MKLLKVKVSEGVPPPVGNPFSLFCAKETHVFPEHIMVVRTGLTFAGEVAVPEVRLRDGLIFCGGGFQDGELVIAVLCCGSRETLWNGEKIGVAAFREAPYAKDRVILDDGQGGTMRVVTGDAVEVRHE